MVHIRIVLFLSLLGGIPVLAIPGGGDFGRYQPILDRRPFGAEAPVVVPGGPETVPSGPVVEPFVKFLRISGIVSNNTSGEILVGIVDTRSNANYLLPVGGTADGVVVMQVDYSADRALLRKESESYWLAMDGSYSVCGTNAATSSLGMTVSNAEPSPATPASGGGALNPSLATPGVMRSSARAVNPSLRASAANSGASRRLTLAERRRLKGELMRRGQLTNAPSGDTAAMPPQQEGELLDKQLQEYQMQLIREGLPPLPIPLTKEMDDQLVSEGILPPLE